MTGILAFAHHDHRDVGMGRRPAPGASSSSEVPIMAGRAALQQDHRRVVSIRAPLPFTDVGERPGFETGIGCRQRLRQGFPAQGSSVDDRDHSQARNGMVHRPVPGGMINLDSTASIMAGSGSAWLLTKCIIDPKLYWRVVLSRSASFIDGALRF